MYVHYHRSTCVTGRALRRALGCRGGFTSHCRRQQPGIRVVNWGNTELVPHGDVLNRSESVANAVNKLRSLQILQEAGLNVPRFSTNPVDFGDATFLGRKRSHIGGRDIAVFEGFHTESVFSDFFTEFVPSENEMRLHVFRGELIGAQVKKWVGEGDVPEIPIRNHDRGWVFVPYMRKRPNQSRIDAAIAAVGALGLDFGAVDILSERDTILEVNTAPGLSERFLSLYVEAIRRWDSDGTEVREAEGTTEGVDPPGTHDSGTLPSTRS